LLKSFKALKEIKKHGKIRADRCNKAFFIWIKDSMVSFIRCFSGKEKGKLGSA